MPQSPAIDPCDSHSGSAATSGMWTVQNALTIARPKTDPRPGFGEVSLQVLALLLRKTAGCAQPGSYRPRAAGSRPDPLRKG